MNVIKSLDLNYLLESQSHAWETPFDENKLIE